MVALPGQRPRRVRGDGDAARWQWRSLLEMAVFLAIVVVLNLRLYPFDPAFIDTVPHPYLVGVALVAAFYGLREGLVAAGLAAVVLVVQLAMQPGASLGGVLSRGIVQQQIGWLLATGYVLGVIRRFGVEQLQRLTESLRQARRQLAMLEEQHQALRATKDELERRIIGQTASVHSLYESVKALESLEVPALHSALLRVVASFTGAPRCSLFLAEPAGGLLLMETYGWDLPRQPVRLAPGQGLLGIAARQQRVVTMNDPAWTRLEQPGAGPLNEQESLLCAPLIAGGRLYGIINIEEVPFQRLTLSTVRILGMLADLASPAIENALTHQEAAAERPADPVTGLLRYAHVTKRLAEECSRALRYKLPLCAMLIEGAGWGELMRQPTDRRQQAIREVCSALRTHLRGVDLVAHDEHPDRFLVVLPLTDLAGALIVAQRLQPALDAASRPGPDGVRWGMSVAGLKDQEDAIGIQRRLRLSLEQAKARGTGRPIVMAE